MVIVGRNGGRKRVEISRLGDWLPRARAHEPSLCPRPAPHHPLKPFATRTTANPAKHSYSHPLCLDRSLMFISLTILFLYAYRCSQRANASTVIAHTRQITSRGQMRSLPP